VAAVKAETALIVADTAELQAAWADGGRLDLILDARASQASVDVVDGIADDIKAVTVKLDTALEADGAVYRFTTNALEQVSVEVGDVEVPIDEAAIAAAVAPVVWAYGTRSLTTPAVQLAAAVLAADVITVLRGDSFSLDLTGLGSLEISAEIWFSAKPNIDARPDESSTVQISLTGGLLRLAGQVGTAALGSLTILDAVTGSVRITLDPAATALLPLVQDGCWDLQMLTSGGAIQTLARGSFAVEADVTRRVS
jgi:hypothetical protein